MNSSMFTEKEIAALKSNKVVIIGNKRYRVCWGCKQIIRVNKPLLGSTHFCTSY